MISVSEPGVASTSEAGNDAKIQVISVVVPVYFNSHTLPALIERLQRVADRVPSSEFEFVFVDDGSRDDSFEILSAASKVDPRVCAIRLSRNFGSNIGILAGLAHANGEAVAVISADLQDPPEMIVEMVAAWREGVDVVLAARGSREDPWLSRTLANTFNLLFRKLAFPDFPPGGFDFMLVSRRVVQILVRMSEKNSYVFGQVMWVGFQRRVLYYHRAERDGGRSRWTLTRKVKYFIDAFAAFSYLPIRLASVLGFLMAFAGVGYALILTALLLANVAFDSGHAAIVITVLIGSGVQLVIVGMIGEYLWRVLDEARNRPLYIIDTTTDATSSGGAEGVGAFVDDAAKQAGAHET